MSVRVGDILGAINSIDDRVRASARKAVSRFTIALAGQCREICPVSPTDPKHPYYIGTSGALRGSINSTPATIEGDVVFSYVGAGSNVNYAIFVHEILTNNHRYPGAPNPKAQAKFIEEPMSTMRPRFTEFCAAAMRSDLAGGGA